MREDFDFVSFFTGLPLGIATALVIGYFVWRKGKKERRFDERHKRIQDQAKSLSWAVTILALVIAWGVIIIVEGPSLSFFLITGVYVLSMITYLVATFISTKKN